MDWRKRLLRATTLVLVALFQLVTGGTAQAGDRVSITGQVTDADGIPIADVEVGVGKVRSRTDAGGIYVLQGVKLKGRVTVAFAAGGFATTYGVIDLGDDDRDGDSDSDSGSDRRQKGHRGNHHDSDSDSGDSDSGDSDSGAGLSITLNKVMVASGAVQIVDAAAGGTLEQDGFKVTFPPGSLKAKGDVEVTISPIDVSTPQLGAFPGDFIGIGQTGGSTLIETFSLMDVDLVDAATGKRVKLTGGAQASLEFLLPASTSLAAGDTVPLWFFRPGSGLWREEGLGTVGASTSVPGRLAVFGQVSHFSWWNCDQPVTSFNCYTGRVVDSAGNPVAGAQVYASGVDYTGTTYATTDAAGNYCVNVRRDSLVEIHAELVFGGVSVSTQTVSVDTTLPEGAVVSCALGGCTAVEDLALAGLTCVSGDVRDELDAPVAGALVVSTTGQFATTAADGSYCFAAPADSGVTVATPGLPPVSVVTGAEGPDCADPGACTPANLRPEPSLTTSCLSGRVVLQGFFPSLAPGDPVPDAIVEAFRSETPFDLLGVAETDAAGEFCLEGLPEGVFVNLSVEGPAPDFCFGFFEDTQVGPAPSTCAADDCTALGDFDCFSEGAYE